MAGIQRNPKQTKKGGSPLVIVLYAFVEVQQEVEASRQEQHLLS